jgi:hypothetical protein
MTLPYPLLFLALLVAYMVYSEWASLDARYLVGAALALLVVAAIADAVGSTAAANSLAEYVLFLLAGGVVLLLVDHLRTGRAPANGDRESPGAVPPVVPTAQPPDERQRPTDQALDRSEQ